MLQSMDSNQGLRICSFDGGGPGVISELFILREILYRLQQTRNMEAMPLPCEYAELMTGCGLGGFVAILLGRLGFTVDQAIEAVAYLGTAIGRMHEDKSLNSGVLRSELKAILKRNGFAEDILMDDVNNTRKQCKTFVCVTPTVTMKTCQRIRTYNSPLDRPLRCTVVDAALATMSSPLHYIPVRIGTQNFVGASMGYNNPTREAILEAWSMFGAEAQVASIFSLGAGISAPKNVEQSLEKPQDVLEDCEKLATELSGQYRETGVYFRLSVDHGLDTPEANNWRDTGIGAIESHTRAYLDKQTQLNSSFLRALEDAINHRVGRVAIAVLNKAYATPTYAKSVPLVTQYFVLREVIWEKMRNALISTDQNKQMLLVMYGAGGSGKTQMVSYFVQQFRQNYDYVFYVDASTTSSLHGDLTSAIRSLGVTYLYGSYNDAIAFLSHSLGIRWLLIYDNADDPLLPLERYFPQCNNGTIIITTRNAQHSGLAPETSIEVGPMDEAEAVKALLQAAQFSKGVNDESQSEARAIVKELGCLPVAIVQAGRYCSKARNLQNYLTTFKKQPRRLLERSNDGQHDRYRYPSAFAALSVSHKELDAAPKTLLHILAFFHHSDIPFSALQIAVESNFIDPHNYVPRPSAHDDVLRRLGDCICPEGDWDDVHIQELLESLEKYSIISTTAATSNQLFRFHPLTRVWAQSILQAQDKIMYWNMAVQILTCFSSEKYESLKNLILPHIHALVDVPFELHPNSGAAFAPLLCADGSFDKACKIWEGVRDRCIDQYGTHHLNTIKATQNLANTLRELNERDRAEKLGLDSVSLSRALGDKELLASTSRDVAITYQRHQKWTEAGELLESALEIITPLKGDESDEAIEISEALALSRQEQGRWKESEVLRVRVLEVRQKTLRKEHPKIIRAMENLAETYLEQGRWAETAKLQEEVLSVRSRSLGAAHPDTMSVLSDLSITYERLGKLSEAATLQQGILHTRRSLLPKDHPDILEAAINLAATYCNQGLWSRASELQREVVEARMALGKEHPDSIDATSELGFTLYCMGRWNEAEKLQKEVVELRRKLLGDEHPDTLTAIRNLASNYSDQGRWKQAEELERQMVNVMGKVMGPDHPETLEASGNLAFTLREQGSWKAAEEIQREILVAYEKKLGKEHPDTLMATSDLAATHSELGAYLQAESLQVELDKTCRRVLGDDHPTSLKALKDLAETYRNMGRFSQSKDLLHKLVKTMRRVMGEEHPETLATGVMLAAVYSGMGKWERCEKLLKQLVETYRKTLGDEHPDSLMAITDLAMVYSETGKWVEASQMQIKTLETCRRVLGPEHPGTLTAQSNLASNQSQMGFWSQARDQQKKVLEVRRRVSGENHPDTLEAIYDLAATYSNMGKFAKSETLLKELVKASIISLGEEHPDTLAATIDLGMVYHEMGRLNDAETLQIKMVEVCQRVLGSEHPDTLTAISNLASTQSEFGQWTIAKDAQEKILEARRRLLGDEHPDTLLAMGELAAIYSQQGKWKLAESLQKEQVKLCKKVLGAEHPDTLVAMSELGETNFEMGRWLIAKEVQKEVVEKSIRVLGPEHPDTIKARSHLASTLSELGHWTESAKLQRELVDVCKEVFGPRHPDTLDALSALASTYAEMCSWDAAEKIQLEVLDIRRKAAGIRRQDSLMPDSSSPPAGQLQDEVEARRRVVGDEHPDTLIALRDLASTYSNTGRWAEGEKLQSSLVESCKRVFGPEHPQTLTVISDLALTYSEMGRFKDAEVFQLKMVETRTRVLGDDHPDTIAAISDLAKTYSNQHRLEEAVKLQADVVEIYLKILGDEHPDTLAAIGDLAATYSEMDRLKEAEDLQIKMVEACKRVLGVDHPETLSAESNLATTLCHMNRWEEAAELQSKTVDTYRRTLKDKHPDTLSAIGSLAHTFTKLEKWAEAEALQVVVVEGWKKGLVGHEHPRYKRANTLLREIRSQKKESQSVVAPTSSEVLASSPPAIDQQPEARFLTIDERTEENGTIRGDDDFDAGVYNVEDGDGDEDGEGEGEGISAPPNTSSIDALVTSTKKGGCCECIIV